MKKFWKNKWIRIAIMLITGLLIVFIIGTITLFVISYFFLGSFATTKIIENKTVGKYEIKIVHHRGGFATSISSCWVSYIDHNTLFEWENVVASGEWKDSASVEFLDLSRIMIVMYDKEYDEYSKITYYDTSSTAIIDLRNPPKEKIKMK